MSLQSCLVGGHFNSGNLTFTPFHLDDVNSIDYHTHETGHNVICIDKSFEVRTKDPTCNCERKQILTQGQHVWIPAGIEHAAIALDGEAFGVCVFVKGTFDFEVPESNNGWPDNQPFNIELPEDQRFKPNPIMVI